MREEIKLAISCITHRDKILMVKEIRSVVDPRIPLSYICAFVDGYLAYEDIKGDKNEHETNMETEN